MFNNKIDVAKGFQTSVNIAYDLNNTGKISGFIPTMSSLDIIEDVLLSTAPNVPCTLYSPRDSIYSLARPLR